MLPLVNHESRFGESSAGVDVVLDDHLALGVVLGMEQPTYWASVLQLYCEPPPMHRCGT